MITFHRNFAPEPMTEAVFPQDASLGPRAA